MPQLPYSIELHDSEVSAIEQCSSDAIVRFSHAYVHRNGKGWSQEAELRIGLATINSTQLEFPAKAADGRLKSKMGPYHNLLTIPLDTDGEVALTIEFFSGKEATIRGQGIKLAFLSEPVFVEDFPAS
jgi:hypothetical protein